MAGRSGCSGGQTLASLGAQMDLHVAWLCTMDVVVVVTH